MQKVLFSLLAVSLFSQSSFAGMSPSKLKLVVEALELGKITKEQIVSIDSIEVGRVLKCLPGIYPVTIMGLAAVDGAAKMAYLEIELGGCGDQSRANEVTVVKELYQQ